MGGSDVNQPAPQQAWRVAALTMMPAEELRALLANAEDSAAWVEAAAACGMAEAQVRLGRMLLEGEGVARDPAAAFAAFSAAAERGDAEARNMAGRCYENGWGVAQSFADAARFYRLAADDGHVWAQYNLGHLLLGGNGVAQDGAAAYRCYLSAANAGHERAMNLVARCCEEGWGTARDAAAARDWYRRAAEAGYFRGAYNFATLLCAEGDIDGALRWFRQALDTAPEPTRSHIRFALARHRDAQLRALAI
jgi:TPR repeat protein